ncbi:MAG: AMP-binding protein [Elusimicrobiota bacterium]|nr:AMP-binding protein [Elusimicrobiota bacterium]
MPTLNGLLDRAAQEGGPRVAFVVGERETTFAALRAEVLSVAAGLSRAGFVKGDRLVIVHRNDPAFVVAYLAVNRLGGVAVPINFMVQKPDELAYMINDCGAKGAVTQAEFLPGLKGAAAKCPTLKTLWTTDDAPAEGPVRPFGELRATPATWAAGDADPAEEGATAAILYTSGTTGFPKGVMLTHGNLLSNAESSIKRMTVDRSDSVLCILPMFHSFCWIIVLIALRLTIKTVVFSNIAPAKPWLKAMGRHRVSLFAGVPQLYAALAREAKDTKTRLFLRWWAFRRVKIAVSGAAPLSAAVAQAFKDAVGVGICEGYGLTETSPVMTINPLADRRFGTVGLPIDGVSVRVVDDAEKELPTGAEGEIVTRGPNVMKGYWNLPDATKAAFTADGWFKTGDVGALDADGYLSIRDRKKDMIIIKGLKVFSAQVEAVIAEHPAVEEAAVVGLPDEEGDEVIKAFVVLKKGAAADKAELMRHFREKLDAYKRPRDVEVLDALPKNALQKVLKRELRDRELKKKQQQPAKA